jgi:hypothetical protein
MPENERDAGPDPEDDISWDLDGTYPLPNAEDEDE